ncbi:hypothetical protein QAD02_000913 [Eretmocerus hayati]|uniref:Uncharacterized protein n=1 Tax=Eretmocerus hayati TaxID=131215 RepID=A0ACC2NEI7_9HYME|nr:hypothetical protein QAD02_000913 [Eretmocerus hayati]
MDANIIASCPLFNKDEEEKLFQFLHLCINEICTGIQATHSQISNMKWTEEEFTNTQKLLVALLSNPSCLYCQPDKMPHAYHKFPQHVQEAILECLTMRKVQLTNALILKCSSKCGPTMTSFDWRLKYVMGSSKMASIREPLLQLDLNFGEEKNEKLQLELTKDELDKMISTLETIAV